MTYESLHRTAGARGWYCAIALLLAALLVPVAKADVGPSIPLDIRVKIENVGDFPKYDFYLKYTMTRGNPSYGGHLMQITSSDVVKLEGSGNRSRGVYLFVVPHGQKVEQPPEGDASKWLANVPDGAMQSEPLNASSGSVSSYRVAIADGKVTLAKTGDPAKQYLGGTLGGHGTIWLMISGMSLALCIVIAGIFWMRRTRTQH